MSYNSQTEFDAFQSQFKETKDHPRMNSVKPAFDYTKPAGHPDNTFKPSNHNDPILHPLRNLKYTIDQAGTFHEGVSIKHLDAHITATYVWSEDQSYMTIYDFLDASVYMVQWYKSRGRTERIDDITGGHITPVTAGQLLELYETLGIKAGDNMKG